MSDFVQATADFYLKTGGYAYPSEQEFVPGGGVFSHPGMTLRDYFAARALELGWYQGEDKSEDGLASYAYRVADAMLKARK